MPPRSPRRVPVPQPDARHLLRRFTYGPTPALVRATRRDHLAWFDDQLRPSRIADPVGDEVDTWWPDLQRTPLDLWLRQLRGERRGSDVMRDYGSWLLARRTHSTRQVHEVMTQFWEDHLHVPVNGDGQFTWRADYGRTLRRHALGRYDRMLAAATTHPAMLVYLDGATSTKAAPNENHGRELLELHTLGAGRYDEDDVKASARILTGWRVDLNDTWQRLYVPEYHWTGPVRVRGFSAANDDPDGRRLTQRYLRHLAHHPDTAATIARKLAVAFVGDEPPAALVSMLARTYLEHGTAIVPVLRALVRSTAFAAAADAKLRDPGQDVVATYRALDVRLQAPVDSRSATAVMLGQTGALGLTTGAWPRPDGPPATNVAWSSPLRALASVDLHWAVATRGWPQAQVVHREPASWLPPLPTTLRDLVDHLSRLLLQRPASTRLLEACELAVATPVATELTETHPVVVHHVGRLLAAVLDQPEHYAR